MKAWYLSNESDYEGRVVIVFAGDREKAKSQALEDELGTFDWTDLRAVRAKHFDDMEGLTSKELMREMWHEGWWFSLGEDKLPIYDDPAYSLEEFSYLSKDDVQDNHLHDRVFDEWYNRTYAKENEYFPLK